MELVPGEGFEPSVEDPKSSALPLGHPGLSLNTLPRRPPVVGSGGVTSGPRAALGLVMRNVLLAVLVLVTAACGAYRFPGSPSPSAGVGTVSGTVVAVPCYPVESAGMALCAGRPVPGVEIDFASADGATKAVTDPKGHYTLTLAGGTWTVHVATQMRVINGPAQLTVLPGSVVSANYVLDSGIRVPVPVPQQ
jgi:hypothetical protein